MRPPLQGQRHRARLEGFDKQAVVDRVYPKITKALGRDITEDELFA